MYAPQAYIAFLSFPSPPLLPPGGSGTQEGCAHPRTPAHAHAATDLRAAAVPWVPQQHNCDSIPGPGTVVPLKVSFFLQSLLPEIH